MTSVRSIVHATAILAGIALTTRHLSTRWGSTALERAAELPGDEFVESCQVQADHAITIRAGVQDVWPWLMQLGQDRGGFYSYEGIENAIGCQIEGSDILRPEWATRLVGDSVNLAPELALKVGAVAPDEFLRFGGGRGHRGPSVRKRTTEVFYLGVCAGRSGRFSSPTCAGALPVFPQT